MGRCGGSGDGVKNGKRPRSNLGSISGSGRFPGEGNGNPLQCSCLENPMDGGAWWATVHGVARSRTWLSNFTLTFHFHALEKEMTTHSNVLAWRIPGTGEPGGLPSLRSHRVGHDWSDLAAAVFCVNLYSKTSSREGHRFWFLKTSFSVHPQTSLTLLVYMAVFYPESFFFCIPIKIIYINRWQEGFGS